MPHTPRHQHFPRRPNDSDNRRRHLDMTSGYALPLSSDTRRHPPTPPSLSPDHSSTHHSYPHIHPQMTAGLSRRPAVTYSESLTQCSDPGISRARTGGAAMGEFDQSEHGTAQGARLPAGLLPPVEVPELPAWSARARRPLTESRILGAVGTGTHDPSRVEALHAPARSRA